MHKDYLGQLVYGYQISKRMDKSLVIQSLDKAKVRFKELTEGIRLISKPIIHQDRGSQYTSHEYVEQALGFGTLSYSRPATPTDNAGQESFFGRFKVELRDDIRCVRDYDELVEFVNQKINYYNNERRHTSIGLVSPRKYTESCIREYKEVG